MAKKKVVKKKKPRSDSEYRKKKQEALAMKKLIGRPPLIYSDEDCVRLGEELLEWLNDKDGGKFCTHFVRWYGIKHQMFEKDWKDLKRRTYFAPYYQKARKILTENIMNNQKVAQSYGNRYIGMYDPELHEWEEEKAERQVEREIRKKKKDVENEKIAFEQLMEDLKKGQLSDKLSQ